eukprot:GHUV01038638.1.p2 GENE.GHUV01038638.1~~GHUV01038638.1.p2  ORF type:complete len:116 (+),score=19.07 GHUV01038638.1:117-464(+)
MEFPSRPLQDGPPTLHLQQTRRQSSACSIVAVKLKHLAGCMSRYQPPGPPCCCAAIRKCVHSVPQFVCSPHAGVNTAVGLQDSNSSCQVAPEIDIQRRGYMVLLNSNAADASCLG